MFSRLLPLAFVLGSLTPLQAQYKAIYTFGGSSEPTCPGRSGTGVLTQTPGGNLINTTNGSCQSGMIETAFEIGFQGANFTVLQNFGAMMPSGGLTLGTDQRFHGVTMDGGSRNHGTVYRLSTAPSIVYEHDFEGGADGGYPWSEPIQSSTGDWYGTTAGASSMFAGTVYKIDTSDRYSVLHVFSTTDGRGPVAALVEGSDSNFYGTTVSGGANGKGVFFRISPTGDFQVLYNFDGTHGSGSAAPLIQASDGNFYGVSSEGGSLNQGVVYKLTPDDAFSVFYDFSATAAQGNDPQGGLVEATDGNFYGTLVWGGAGGVGSIYRLTPAGVFTDIHDFYTATGANPQSTLLQHTTGKLYGTTANGGANNDGVIFEYDPGLAPFVTFLPVYGQVGATVDILGEYFAEGVTTVYFNGVPAQNPKIASTYIEATVPDGATTGYITVTSTKGTLKSNKPFVVH